MSQLDLATEAEVSQRHLSFLETGRAKPSREMVMHLSVVLDVPPRERNQLLGAAGFSPTHPEHGLDEPAMDQVRHVLDLMLAAHHPFPAYVVDRRWDLVLSNDVAMMLTSSVATPDTMAALGGNLARLTLHPDGIRPFTANWEEAATVLLQRLRREARSRPTDTALAELVEEVSGYPDVGGLPEADPIPDGSELLIPLHLTTPLGDLRFYTMIATIGAAHDLTLEELRLETLLPADEATESVLRSLSSG